MLDVPSSSNYPATVQQKARAVYHWDLLAAEVADKMATKAALDGLEKNTFQLVPPVNTPFNRAFGDLLLTRLVARGLTITSAPGIENAQGAFIRFDVQLVSGADIGKTTRTELLVTTSMEWGQRFISRTSDIYYIDQGDAKLFMQPPPPPAPPPPAPTKDWKVVGT